MKETNSIRSTSSDMIGIVSAVLCAIHCLAAPLVLMLFAAAEFWDALTYVFLAISFVAVWSATRHSHSVQITRIIWVSFVVLAISVVFEHQVHAMHYLSYAASGGLIIGHTKNIKACRVSHQKAEA